MKKLFEYYAGGTCTLAKLAGRLNDQGFTTRNKRPLTGANGDKVAGPRLFTICSVRWVLHNSFFIGKVRHGRVVYRGVHEPIADGRLF